MKLSFKKIPYRRIALTFTLCALILWGVLGTGTSLAWFTDTTPEITNIFHVGEFELSAKHLAKNGNWESIDGKTDVFDNEAIYEPGYVQTVYLEVKNEGTIPFEFFTAVNVNGSTGATNVYGQSFLLQDYLKFGIATADSFAELEAKVSDRDKAVLLADMPLHNYDTETARLDPEQTKYIAIIVRMPEDVGNVANYYNCDPPTVELGITVKAEQIH